jgi:hypothetical protein
MEQRMSWMFAAFGAVGVSWAAPMRAALGSFFQMILGEEHLFWGDPVVAEDLMNPTVL